MLYGMTLHQTYQKCDNILSVSDNEQVRKSKKHQTQQICIFGFHTHTQAGGGKEGGNKDSQPQATRGKQGKQQRQRTGKGSTQQAGGRTKERKGGREGGESTEPNPGRQKSKSAKQNVQQGKPEEGEGGNRT
jgi:hypothetical protein